jgi:hypothetical protein
MDLMGAMDGLDGLDGLDADADGCVCAWQSPFKQMRYNNKALSKQLCTLFAQRHVIG